MQSDGGITGAVGVIVEGEGLTRTGNRAAECHDRVHVGAEDAVVDQGDRCADRVGDRGGEVHGASAGAGAVKVEEGTSASGKGVTVEGGRGIANVKVADVSVGGVDGDYAGSRNVEPKIDNVTARGAGSGRGSPVGGGGPGPGGIDIPRASRSAGGVGGNNKCQGSSGGSEGQGLTGGLDGFHGYLGIWVFGFLGFWVFGF